jgi:hypothetical protein
MSYGTYYELLRRLDSAKDIEAVNYHYSRVFFQDSALAKNFVDALMEKKERVDLSADVDLEARVVGKRNSLVLVRGLGAALERSESAFEVISNLILRYTGSGSQDELKTSGRRRRSGSGTAVVKRKDRRKEKSETREGSAAGGSEHSPKDQETEGGESPLEAEGEVEMHFSEYILKEEVDTCRTMIAHAASAFSLEEDEAEKKLHDWAEKNAAAGKIEYDKEYMDGEGLVSLKL